ncbi:MAG: SLBB domain-containing protein, partial [Spirochaetaceae bacterium]|nr:SLBB domain-containing protein [Spirochaetaceae bacterium]
AGPASAAASPALHSVPQAADPAAAAKLTLLRRVGRADPESLSDYRRHGGCSALRCAVELGPVGVLRELRDSRLQGRGGAAFPTAAKWEAVAGAAARPHYVVCNADESEPGTFKDRVVMEQDPFAVIEALVIAGFTTGATTGYLYIRGEYPLATRRLLHAIAQARAWGLLGSDIMGLGVDFDVEVRRGAGAYICGEETALFNSLEGFRGEPRSKPPYPTEAGLFGKPTAVNNVETLINLLPIMLGGGRSYAAVGTEQSTGPKLFCLSGAVARPGVYEVEFGTTLRDLLALAGGTTGGQPRAILLGGAAGSFVGSEHLDLPLTFEDTRAAGTTLGSGVVMPFAPGTDFLDITRRIAQFFRDESCGQCVPCRVGTVRQEEALQRWAAGGGAEQALLADLAQVMSDASICGLGHTAASALQSALRLGLLDRNGEG